jgi:hypothetical protein
VSEYLGAAESSRLSSCCAIEAEERVGREEILELLGPLDKAAKSGEVRGL